MYDERVVICSHFQRSPFRDKNMRSIFQLKFVCCFINYLKRSTEKNCSDKRILEGAQSKAKKTKGMNLWFVSTRLISKSTFLSNPMLIRRSNSICSGVDLSQTFCMHVHFICYYCTTIRNDSVIFLFFQIPMVLSRTPPTKSGIYLIRT